MVAALEKSEDSRAAREDLCRFPRPSELGSTLSFFAKAALVLLRGHVAGLVIAAMLFEAEV